MLVFPKTVRLNIIMYCFINYLCDIVPYFTIKSNILFRPLNPDKASKQHTGYSKFFSQHVPGLSNRCTFELANGLAGKFISRY